MRVAIYTRALSEPKPQHESEICCRSGLLGCSKLAQPTKVKVINESARSLLMDFIVMSLPIRLGMGINDVTHDASNDGPKIFAQFLIGTL
jgi:hypothetical protein